MKKEHSKEEAASLTSENLLQFLYLNRTAIVIFCALAAILSAVGSFMIEEKYKSTVILFPSSADSFGKVLNERSSKVDFLEFGEKEKGEQLLQIIESASIRERVIEKYDLMSHYGMDATQPGAISRLFKAYNESVNAELTRYGSIEITVMDKSPELAMNMANDIAALTDTVRYHLKKNFAAKAIPFAEEEVENISNEIAMWEDSIFQYNKSGVFNLEVQIDRLIEQYGLAVVENNTKAIAILKKDLDIAASGSQYLTGIEYLLDELYDRRHKVKGTLEQLKVDLRSPVQSNFVLDRAIASDKKAYPVRWLIVVLGTLSAFVFIVFVLLIRNSIKELNRADKD